MPETRRSPVAGGVDDENHHHIGLYSSPASKRVNDTNVPTLPNKRLCVRLPRSSDAARALRYSNDPQLPVLTPLSPNARDNDNIDGMFSPSREVVEAFGWEAAANDANATAAAGTATGHHPHPCLTSSPLCAASANSNSSAASLAASPLPLPVPVPTLVPAADAATAAAPAMATDAGKTPSGRVRPQRPSVTQTVPQTTGSPWTHEQDGEGAAAMDVEVCATHDPVAPISARDVALRMLASSSGSGCGCPTSAKRPAPKGGGGAKRVAFDLERNTCYTTAGTAAATGGASSCCAASPAAAAHCGGGGAVHTAPHAHADGAVTAPPASATGDAAANAAALFMTEEGPVLLRFLDLGEEAAEAQEHGAGSAGNAGSVSTAATAATPGAGALSLSKALDAAALGVLRRAGACAAARQAQGQVQGAQGERQSALQEGSRSHREGGASLVTAEAAAGGAGGGLGRVAMKRMTTQEFVNAVDWSES
jgi:hypothetical protein